MDPVTPIGMAPSGTSAIENQQRCTASLGQSNLEQCTDAPSGAYVQQVIIIGRRTPVSMNIVSAGAMFSDRIRTGFYATQVEQRVAHANDPNVTAGEQVAAAIEVQERIATAHVVNQIAHKLADGLQTVVAKSG
jgi:hypothetical protein